MSSYAKILETAALKAGRYLARDFGEIENLQVSKKGPGNFVTSADLKSEKILIEELQKAKPDFGFLTEETGEIKGKDSKFRFIIDPIDGTTNFMHGLPHFCISLALEQIISPTKSEIIAGCIYAPILDELYSAEKGQGAYVNNRRLSVSSRKNLEDCMVVGTISSRDESVKQFDLKNFDTLKTHHRFFGSAALDLAYVAAGKFDALWHKNLKPWDIAAGILLVREARGMVTELDGGSQMLENGNILATNSEVHDSLLKHFRKVK
jgi:myo-inositol-1(or 4)-monophosphatase